MIEMSIEGIRVSLMNYQRVVILKEKEADRYLPIWIGPAEAEAITVRLQGVAVARPLTHDLLQDVMEKLGAQIVCVVVNDLADDTFFARIMVSVNGEQLEIDSRPSDAIALAIRVDAPIFVRAAVFEAANEDNAVFEPKRSVAWPAPAPARPVGNTSATPRLSL